MLCDLDLCGSLVRPPQQVGAWPGLPFPPSGTTWTIQRGWRAGRAASSSPSPRGEADLDPGQPLELQWSGHPDAAFHPLEVTCPSGDAALSAVLVAPVASYSAPSWLRDQTGPEGLRWRVVALDQVGEPLATTAWRVGRWQ